MKNFLLSVCMLLLLTTSASASYIDFSSITYKTLPIQHESGTWILTPDVHTIFMEGNTWVSFDIADITVDGSTKLRLDVNDTGSNEILGLQFNTTSDLDLITQANASQAFQFAGSQPWGIQTYDLGDDPAAGWHTIDIALGTHLNAGTYGSLTFIVDKDTQSPDGEGIFRNLEFNPVPEPATMLLFGIGLLSVAGVNRRKK